MKSRRQFHKTVAALATGSATAATALAQPNEQPKDPAAATAEALFTVIRARYGQFLTAEQLDLVQRSVRNRVATAETLRRVQLKNSDEPAFAFSADIS